MQTTYTTTVIGHGNHAAIEIPPQNLAELGANRRAPLRITINDYTYQSTATGVGGKCMVVFPQKDRDASGASAGDTITVRLELDTGHREVSMPAELVNALDSAGLTKKFEALTYSKRKEFARQVAEAKAEDTRQRRIQKVLNTLSS
ncbi:YdeI/OmpD-associated family protein [Candidatus Saccharibacteria bacterium]|nr:YdeI/OmpD-associated family protein [Candidatus Saccharibacteria bacterium]